MSFSSRIPNALPVGDAMSMSNNVELFNPIQVLNLKEIFKNRRGQGQVDDANDVDEFLEKESGGDPDGEKDKPAPGGKNPDKKTRRDKYRPPPIACLITKHNNGTLNLWNVMFAEKSKFSQLLNIGHESRVSGHRFRVNGITAHPVLPLLLTTSHHNTQSNQIFYFKY